MAKFKQSFKNFVLPNIDRPETIVILPLSEQPFFPSQIQPLVMNELPWLESVKAISDKSDSVMGLFFVNKDTHGLVKPKDFPEIGTLAKMYGLGLNDHKIHFHAEGLARIKIKKWLTKEAPYKVEIEYIEEVLGANSKTLKAHSMSIVNLVKKLISFNPVYTRELRYFLDMIDLNDPSLLSDFAINMAHSSPEDMQLMLEEKNVKKRMSKALKILQKTIDVSSIQQKIQRSVDYKMDEQQRVFFLKEQLKVIEEELGISKDDKTAEIDKFIDRLEFLKVPAHANEAIEESLDKLSYLEIGSPEYAVTRNYLDWLTILPWGVSSKDRLNLPLAKKVLNQHHYGMDDVKNRILEFVSVAKLKGGIDGSIILLVGPPGVGKTSIGRAIAESLNREFFRFSVGGMRDEAEIKGHRRTYIGAMPGKLIQSLKQTKTDNPLIMLDEVDKILASYAGDPSSTLLEVLDPEQNNKFLDHYLDISFDLSKVVFVCTANDMYSIPGPLRDRMEIIEVSGYIAEEKLEISKRYLVPKQIEKNGLSNMKVNISDASLMKVIEGYSREAGVRSLEKNISKILRKVALTLVQKKQDKFNVSIKHVEDFLGKPLFEDDQVIGGAGTVTGLAWTSMGGATLTIESSLVHTKNRGFKLTGQLGDVMQESAEIAYSYICGNIKKYKLNESFFDKSFVHLHVPSGSVPKDGPSAGITMATALLSLARNQKVSRKLAMTGEITLTGKVLPIGGLREKVIAARRIGVFELLFPMQNKQDFEELPSYIKHGIRAHFVKSFSEVEKIVFSSDTKSVKRPKVIKKAKKTKKTKKVKAVKKIAPTVTEDLEKKSGEES